MAKEKTNVQFLTHLMNYSQQGALMQAFVMTALEAYAKEVVATEPWDDKKSMVRHESWKKCADEVLAGLDEHFDRKPATLPQS